MKFRLISITAIALVFVSVSSVFAQLAGDTTGTLLVQGRKLVNDKNYAEAINTLNKLLTRDPNNLEALHLIAGAYSMLGNTVQSRTYYQRVLKNHPDDVDALVGIGASYSNEKQNSKALEFFEQAVKLDSSNILALTNLGKQQAMNGQISKALVPLRRAITLAPKDKDVCFALAGAFATAKMYDSAEFYYKQSIMAGKETFPAFYYLAVVLQHEGKTDEAVKGYKAAIGMEPENKDCLRALGQLYIKTNQFSLAKEEFNRLIALDSAYLPGWQGLGLTLALDGQYARADSVIQLLMYLDSTSAYALLQSIRDERRRIEAEASDSAFHSKQ